MKIFRGYQELKSGLQNCHLTIGNFDGVHLGHQKIIKQIVENAKKANGVLLGRTHRRC